MLGSASNTQRRRRREERARRKKGRLCTGKRWRAEVRAAGGPTTYVDCAASSSSLDASHASHRSHRGQPRPAPSRLLVHGRGLGRGSGKALAPPAAAVDASCFGPGRRRWGQVDHSRRTVICGLSWCGRWPMVSGTGMLRPACSDAGRFTGLDAALCSCAALPLHHTIPTVHTVRTVHIPRPLFSAPHRLPLFSRRHKTAHPCLSPRPVLVVVAIRSPSSIGRQYTNTLHFILPLINDPEHGATRCDSLRALSALSRPTPRPL